jgi:hypothetical protein
MLADGSRGNSAVPTEAGRNEEISRSYALGMIALAKGKREEALGHFRDRLDLEGSNDTKYWTDTFVHFLEHDQGWPIGNRRVHPHLHEVELSEQR